MRWLHGSVGSNPVSPSAYPEIWGWGLTTLPVVTWGLKKQSPLASALASPDVLAVDEQAVDEDVQQGHRARGLQWVCCVAFCRVLKWTRGQYWGPSGVLRSVRAGSAA